MTDPAGPHAAVDSALAALAVSDDPADAPPAPSADAVRLAALERSLADRLTTADRSARRWRRAAVAAATCAVAAVVAAGLFIRQVDQRSEALARRVDAVHRSQSRGPAGPRLWEAQQRELTASLAETRADLADLDAFADALMNAHLSHTDLLAAARRDRAAQRADLDELAGELRSDRGTADRRFRLLASDAVSRPRPDF